MSAVLSEHINIFDLIGGKFIISEQQINICIRNIQDYNTTVPYDIKKFNLNSTVTNDVLERSNSSLKVTWGTTTSSHGLIYTEPFQIDASTKYLLIQYKLDGSVNIIPYIRNMNNTVLYWRNVISNLMYKKIDPNTKIHTYLIKIPDDPNTPLEQFKLYLLGDTIIKGGISIITDLSIVQVSKLPKITINISI
jgi:hypothetical protein